MDDLGVVRVPLWCHTGECQRELGIRESYKPPSELRQEVWQKLVIPLAAPERGTSETEVVCPSCNRKVTISIESRRSAFWREIRTAVPAGLFLLTIGVGGIILSRGRLDWSLASIGWVLSIPIGIFWPASVLMAHRRRAHGEIRILQQQWVPDRHNHQLAEPSGLVHIEPASA